MGNMGSSSSGRRRRRRRHPRLEPPQLANVPAHHPPPQYPTTLLPPYHHNYPGYYPRPSTLVDGQLLPCGPVSPAVVPYVEHEKAVTIRNDVNIKKDTLRMEPDRDNPGDFLVAFTFDATAPGCITQGLCQKFRQPSGTGIEFSMLEETGLTKEGDMEVYPLVLKAEAQPLSRYENYGNPSSQITLASFEKREKGGYKVQVIKQVLWVNGKRYELQEIYGIGNASGGDFDGHESSGECVICLSEPRDITVLPCRHMCMCSGCANLLKAHTANCPICRHPVERLLEIKVNNGAGDR